MTYVEFLEALARCADKFDIQYMTNEFPGYKSRSPFLLDKKLESMIIQLFRQCLKEKDYNGLYGQYKAIVEAEMSHKKATKFAKVK